MPEPKAKMTAVILAGGNSIRMGQNKAFIQIDGVPITTRIQTLLSELFEEILIVTNQEHLFKTFAAKICTDLIPNKGALGGLYTGIYYSTFRHCFCVACDMPFINRSLVQFLISKVNDEDAIVPRTSDGLQPLHAIYSKACVQAIKTVMDQGRQRIIDFYDLVRLKVVEESEFIQLDPLRESFINVNTPEELLFIRKAKELRTQ